MLSTTRSFSMLPRQHRLAAQRAVKRAVFELGQARSAYASATETGSEAAMRLVNAHLTAEYAPQWPLPQSVASQPGLMPAVLAKLNVRATDAAAAVQESLTHLRAAVEAMHAAARLLCGGGGTAFGVPSSNGGAAASPHAFDPEVMDDTVIVFTALTLPVIGVCAPCMALDGSLMVAPLTMGQTSSFLLVCADALFAETLAMYTKDMRLKERIAGLLCGLRGKLDTAMSDKVPAASNTAACSDSLPTREELHAWLDAWQVCPPVDPTRLRVIEALLADDA